MNRINNSSSLGQTHAVANSESTSNPTGVDQPDLGFVLLAHLSQLLSIDVRVHGQEGLSEAGREGGNGFNYTHFSTSNLGGVSTDEVIHCLFRLKLGNGRHYSVSIAGQEYNVLRMTSDSRELHVLNVLKRIADTGVGGERGVVVINQTRPVFILMVLNILNQCPESDSIKNVWLLLAGKSITLGVATTFNVEYTGVCPDVLVITY